MNQPVTRYAPYLWLVYLGALVFQPAFDPDTAAADWVATGVMVAAFLPLYRASLAERDQRRLMFLLAAMAGLGVVGTLVNAGAGVFVVYAAADDDPYLQLVLERRLPVVVVDQPSDVPGASRVGIDDRAAMRELAATYRLNALPR